MIILKNMERLDRYLFESMVRITIKWDYQG
jgi:hypothetical protein